VWQTLPAEETSSSYVVLVEQPRVLALTVVVTSSRVTRLTKSAQFSLNAAARYSALSCSPSSPL